MLRSLMKSMMKLLLRFLRRQLAHVDVDGARRWAARVDWLLGRAEDDMSTSQVDIGSCMATWIDVPTADTRQVILYFHGGAFIMETPRIHARLLAQFCPGTKARALMVAYRLAPEHPFPAAVNDCLAAYR